MLAPSAAPLTEPEMSIRSVCYLPEDKARVFEPGVGHVLISITEPGRAATVRPGWRKIIRARFVDTEYDERSLAFAGIDWWISSGAISPIQACALRAEISALAALPDQVDLVIHCHAGQSRSAAVAQYIADAYGAALMQGRSPKANKTVLALLHDPWCLISEADYERVMYSFWQRLGRAIRRVTRRKSSAV